jgi:hypothetical protein
MNPNQSTPENLELVTPLPKPAKRIVDPILQEVYDIKAKLNAEAGYSVHKIFERARLNAARLATKHP